MLRILRAIAFFGMSQSLQGQEVAFPASKSMMDAAERLLKAEKDPQKKLEIIFRWVSIREEFEQNQMIKADQAAQGATPTEQTQPEKYKASKTEILRRLESELPYFENMPGLNISRLIRELAFRHLEQKNYESARRYYERLSPRTSSDEIAYGDTLLGLKMHEQALIAYKLASTDDKQFAVATYKMAWAYLQLNDFENSLTSFDLALKLASSLSNQMREEAYRDRILPYLEVFSKPTFEEGDAQAFKGLALQVRPNDTEQQKKLIQEAFTRLIEGFNIKDKIEISQQVFAYFSNETSDPTEVLLKASPLWLKAYRARLRHDEVEKILRSLPDKELDASKASNLQAELHNSAVFYETMVGDLKEEPDPLAKTNLVLAYQKYFVLFPKDQEVDGLRVNYSRLLLEGGDATQCLMILGRRSKKDAEIEKAAISLEARCELKHLDQLYARSHDDYFYAKLGHALFISKIYLKPEIGIEARVAFEGLVSMLVGAIQKAPRSEYLRENLKQLLADFPYPKTDKTYLSLRVISAELRYDDLVVAEMDPEQKAVEFLIVFDSVPTDVPVAKKSLRSAVLLSRTEVGINRCDKIRSLYGEEFTLHSEVFDRCLKLAQEYLRLEKEEEYLLSQQNSLKESDRIHLALIQMGLAKPEGLKRLQLLKTAAAEQSLALWNGESAPKEAISERAAEIEKQVNQFIRDLKPISFQKLAKIVPIKLNEIKTLDAKLLKISARETQGLASAHLLHARAKLFVRFFDWFSKLPEPPGLNAEELAEYKKQSDSLVAPWREAASRNALDCSETAYPLSPDFVGSEVCPDLTKASAWNQALDAWDKRRQFAGLSLPWASGKESDVEKAYETLLKAGRNSQWTETRRKYFLIRALALTQDRRLQAQVYLELAKLTQKPRYWLAANELDSNLTEPIEWLKSQTKNPFYLKLYDRQIELSRSGKRYSPEQVYVPTSKSMNSEL